MFNTKYDGEIIWDHDKPDGTFKKNLEISELNQLVGPRKYREWS